MHDHYTSRLSAAQHYRELGLAVTPVLARSKQPLLKNWPEAKIAGDELARRFADGATNIGVILGAASGGLVDIDLDDPLCASLAQELLPETNAVFGRASKLASHRLYRCDPLPKFEQFNDIDGTSLVEIRSDSRHQTVFPPSIHPSGEVILWEVEAGIARVNCDKLREAVARLAAVVLVARHWPSEGGRQAAALALAGGLLSAGWSLKDTKGFVAAVAQAAADGEPGKRVSAADATQSRLSSGGPVTGWPTLAEGLGDSVVERLRKFLQVSPSLLSHSPLTSQRREEPEWPAPPDSAAFHGLAGQIVRAIEPHTEADPVALLVQLLAAFGNVIGRLAYFVADGARHHGNLFVVLVGDTSKGRKGTAWSHIENILRVAAPAWVERHVVSGLSSGEGLIWSVRDPISKRVPVKQQRKPTGQFEDVIDDCGVDDKRLLVQESEFASALRALPRRGNTLSPVARLAWDGRTLRSLTKHSPACSTGAHITIVAHITRDELLRILDRTETANGFGNRFLWVCVRRSKLLPEGGRIQDVDFGGMIEQLRATITWATGRQELKRDEDARLAWREVYAQLSRGVDGLVGALTSRAEAQVTRLSILYALLDKSPLVREEHLRAALALWEYCENSVLWIFGGCLGDPIADEILKALNATPAGLSRTEISQVLGGHRTTQEISVALDHLCQRGKASHRTEPTPGRNRERWFANAKAK